MELIRRPCADSWSKLVTNHSNKSWWTWWEELIWVAEDKWVSKNLLRRSILSKLKSTLTLTEEMSPHEDSKLPRIKNKSHCPPKKDCRHSDLSICLPTHLQIPHNELPPKSQSLILDPLNFHPRMRINALLLRTNARQRLPFLESRSQKHHSKDKQIQRANWPENNKVWKHKAFANWNLENKCSGNWSL